MKDIYLLCHLSRQAHYQAVQREIKESEKEILYIRAMEQVREIHPGMGLRTLYEMLQPQGIGRDAFVALGLREGFRLKAPDKQVRTTYSVKTNRYRNLLGGREFTDVNQVWSSDITYLFCLGRTYYIVLIMDVYSRRILGYSVADNMRAENNMAALNRALHLRGISHYHNTLIHHSDKGSQYAADVYTETLEAYGIQISMCEEVYENTHMERVNDTLKNQYLNRMAINSEKELQQRVAAVVGAYNEERPHQALGLIAPTAFEATLKELPKEKRKKLKIFTLPKKQDLNNPAQLKLVFDS